MHVAILDTDSGFIRVLANGLERIGWQYRVLGAPPLPEDLVPMRLNALVLDVDLLGPASSEFLGRVSSLLPGMSLIVCTGRTSVAQRVRGLRLGADDWLTKPCHPEEVIARVEAAVRRGTHAAMPADQAPLRAGELEIRPGHFQAFVRGENLELTRREFELLILLARADGQVLEREEIYRRVWGYAMARGDRSVDVFVRKIRQKLEKASPRWQYIHTHFGIGYRFEPQSDEPEPAEPVLPALRAPKPAAEPEPLAERRAEVHA